MQDCSNSIANALELLQSCTKPSIYSVASIGNFNVEIRLIFIMEIPKPEKTVFTLKQGPGPGEQWIQPPHKQAVSR